MEINGKVYPLWSQFVEKKQEWVGGTLQDEGDFLALMRAEVSYLSRPERIEDMARKTLKLEPIASTQLVPWSAVAPGSAATAQTSSAPLVRKDGIAALIEKASTQTAPSGVR